MIGMSATPPLATQFALYVCLRDFVRRNRTGRLIAVDCINTVLLINYVAEHDSQRDAVSGMVESSGLMPISAETQPLSMGCLN